MEWCFVPRSQWGVVLRVGEAHPRAHVTETDTDESSLVGIQPSDECPPLRSSFSTRPCLRPQPRRTHF